MSSAKPPKIRTLRSFVRRQGRLTQGQQHALEHWFPRFGISADSDLIDLDQVFGNTHPVILEIGFGNGESLAQNALDNPDRNYLGIEVHRPGAGHLLLRIAELELSNVRVIIQDAMDVICERLPPASLSGVQVFFPDPWHKKRHHKRRLVQTEFLDIIAGLLKPGGGLHLATDWAPYAAHMLAVTDAHPAFVNQAGDGRYSERPASRPLTKFERRGHRLGHAVYDLLLTRKQDD